MTPAPWRSGACLFAALCVGCATAPRTLPRELQGLPAVVLLGEQKASKGRKASA